MDAIGASAFDSTIPDQVRLVLMAMIGKQCCRQRVGEYKSLIIGFGEKIPHSRKKAIDSYRGEWEIGTYCSAWRLIANGRVICGSMDPVDSNAELDNKLAEIELGAVVSVKMTSKFDFCLELDNHLRIEFLCMTDYDDEVVFIFGPDNLYVQFKQFEGWQIGKSNVPWES